MWKLLYIALARLYIALALSERQCGILTMIDTPILDILYEKKIFENVETSLYSPSFFSRTVWNTNDDRYSNFGHFIRNHLPILAIFIETFLDFGHFLNVQTSVRDVSKLFSKMAHKIDPSQ